MAGEEIHNTYCRNHALSTNMAKAITLLLSAVYQDSFINSITDSMPSIPSLNFAKFNTLYGYLMSTTQWTNSINRQAAVKLDHRQILQ